MISTFLFWFHVAKQQEAYIKNLISENLKNKFKITYSLKTTGYPNRVDTTVSDIKIKSKTNKDLITIKNLLIMSLIYNRKNYILSIEPAINIKVGTNLFEINEGDLNASIKYSNDKLINNFTFHATNIQSYINKKRISTSEVLNSSSLKKLKLINKNTKKLKILGTGEIKDKINIEADLASKSALEKLEKIGGSIQLKK